jgi:hypothetical protein
MEELSPEGRSLYELLKTESQVLYEERFLAHKKEVIDGVRGFVTDTNKQLKGIEAKIFSVQHAVETELMEVTAVFHSDLESVRLQLSTELAHLSDSVDRVFQPGSSGPTVSQAATVLIRDPVDGPDGHRCTPHHRGTGCAQGTPPPVRGTNSDRIFSPSPAYACRAADSDALASAPRVELPHFDGTNSKLWQRRCEGYFHRWEMPACH